MPLLGTTGAASARGFGFTVGGLSFPTFALSQTLTNPVSSTPNFWFGWDLDFDNSASRLIISAPQQTGGSANPQGAVFYYSRSGTSFAHDGTVYGTTSHSYQFGRGVSLSDNGAVYGVSSGGDRQYLYTWPSTQTRSTTTSGNFEEATFAWTASSPTSIVWTQNQSTAATVNSLNASGGTGSISLNSVGYLIKNIKSYPANRIAFMGYSGSANCDIYTINTSTGGLSYSSLVTTGNGVAFTAGACPATSGDGNYLFIGYTSGGTGYLQMFSWSGSAYTYVTTITRSSVGRFGISVVTNHNGTVIAVGDDQASPQNVYIYQRSGSSLTLRQTISGGAGRFGYTMAMNQDSGATSTYLAVGDKDVSGASGAVYIYRG
jgi:hypothetical protein